MRLVVAEHVEDVGRGRPVLPVSVGEPIGAWREVAGKHEDGRLRMVLGHEAAVRGFLVAALGAPGIDLLWVDSREGDWSRVVNALR